MAGELLLILCSLFFSADPPKFTAQTVDDKVAIGYGLAIGDVDGDGKPDILLADKKQFVWYRNGDWKRFVMVDNLTASDNVCLAARDIDGDGKVEVAVGAQWNPGETTDTTASGSVHYLIRPDDPTQLWTPVKLHHEPTIHRMRWVKVGPDRFQLIVLPLHGRGNKGGEGKGVRVIAYEKPQHANTKWTFNVIDESMHLTHNMDVVAQGDEELFYVGGKEGIRIFRFRNNQWDGQWLVEGSSLGELRHGRYQNGAGFITGLEPMHGTSLTIYKLESPATRVVLDEDFSQGHALATADLTGLGRDQIVAGWREPNGEKKVGIKIYIPAGEGESQWKSYWIDDNTMACEDVRLADLNADGKVDIIAAGRATHNLKIYWNKN
jgi:hypothetical protein